MDIKQGQKRQNASFIESRGKNSEKDASLMKKFESKDGRNYCSPSHYRKTNASQRHINISNKQNDDKVLKNRDQNIKQTENYSTYYKTEHRGAFSKKHASLAPSNSEVVEGWQKYNSDNYLSKNELIAKLTEKRIKMNEEEERKWDETIESN